MIKLTQHYLDKLQDLLERAGYTIRHEKGNFKSGSCVMEASKLIVLNKFSPVETKVSFLVEALRTLQIDESLLDADAKKLYRESRQTELKLTNE
jgi:hypothetical protein